MPEVVQVDFKLKLEEPSSNIVYLSNIYMHKIYAMMNSMGISFDRSTLTRYEQVRRDHKPSESLTVEIHLAT